MIVDWNACMKIILSCPQLVATLKIHWYGTIRIEKSSGLEMLWLVNESFQNKKKLSFHENMKIFKFGVFW